LNGKVVSGIIKQLHYVDLSCDEDDEDGNHNFSFMDGFIPSVEIILRMQHKKQNKLFHDAPCWR